MRDGIQEQAEDEQWVKAEWYVDLFLRWFAEMILCIV